MSYSALLDRFWGETGHSRCSTQLAVEAAKYSRLTFVMLAQDGLR